jgi:hypothetical protein
MQLKSKKRLKHPNCNCSAVPQMRGRDLRSVLLHMSQADDKADVVLLGSC